MAQAVKGYAAASFVQRHERAVAFAVFVDDVESLSVVKRDHRIMNPAIHAVGANAAKVTRHLKSSSGTIAVGALFAWCEYKVKHFYSQGAN